MVIDGTRKLKEKDEETQESQKRRLALGTMMLCEVDIYLFCWPNKLTFNWVP